MQKCAPVERHRDRRGGACCRADQKTLAIGRNVVVFEYPAGKAPSRLNNDYYVRLVSAYAKGSEARLRKHGPVTVAGRSGFEAIADDGKGKLNHLVDIVPAGNRIYMLATAGPRNHATGDDAERFRDSFRLLGEETQSQSAGTAPAPAQ